MAYSGQVLLTKLPAESQTEWLRPGRKTVEGYLLVVRGQLRQGNKGLLEELIRLKIEEARPGTFPRYRDIHAVWFGKDKTKPLNHQMQWPFLRYKSPRSINGLRRECSGHHIRLTCTVGKRFTNGLGAYITLASGECLECPR